PLLTRIVPVSCIGSMLPRGVFLLGLWQGPDVGPVRPKVGALSVGKLHDDHRRLVAADDQAVGVDDLRLLVVGAVLGARRENAVADGKWFFDHPPITRCPLPFVSEPEHPAAKAGRLVRAVGLGIARELEKRADAPPKAPPEPPPPPPAENTRG